MAPDEFGVDAALVEKARERAAERGERLDDVITRALQSFLEDDE